MATDKHRLGVLVQNLAQSQLAFFLLRSLNEGLENEVLEDAVVFAEEVSRPCVRPRFAVMHTTEAWNFDGLLVATDAASARVLSAVHAAPARAFYAWDLEWTRGGPRPASEWRSLYLNPAYSLVARSPSHAGLIARCWREPAGVCPDFDLASLLAAFGRKGAES